MSKNGKIGVAIVADGHSGEKYFRSEKGSELAVKISTLAIFHFSLKFFKDEVINHSNKNEDVLIQIESNIIYQWRKEVLEDIKNNPLNENEKIFCISKNIDINNEDDLISIYGTTLIAAFIAEFYWLAIKMGDGVCVIINKAGKVSSRFVPKRKQG
jgi:serine/threonine protein phosphatase PrpC